MLFLVLKETIQPAVPTPPRYLLSTPGKDSERQPAGVLHRLIQAAGKTVDY